MIECIVGVLLPLAVGVGILPLEVPRLLFVAEAGLVFGGVEPLMIFVAVAVFVFFFFPFLSCEGSCGVLAATPMPPLSWLLTFAREAAETDGGSAGVEAWAVGGCSANGVVTLQCIATF